MKSIGGYFGLECGKNPPFYKDGIYLNICRSGFRYLIRALGIKQIYVPYYTCHVVFDAIQAENCTIEKYFLGHDMLPDQEFPKDAYIIYNNYFGVLGNKVTELAKKYENLIVDNAQAFYSDPPCRAAVYSPRKFFGLPDGGILRGRDIKELNLEEGHSTQVSSHLLIRHDYNAESGYSEFSKNDEALEDYDLQLMSSLTRTLMGNINYDLARERRLENFKYLDSHLHTSFPIDMATDDVPMVYPLYLDNGDEIRNNLIKNKVFCARYWPNVIDSVDNDRLEYRLASNLVLLPIDQRYTISDMETILDLINIRK